MTAPPTNPVDLTEIYRAKWTAAKREAYHKEHPENFAGPDDTYPIEDASDVEDAWGLAGHASDPDAVRAKIKEIAKRLGIEHSLPDTAKEGTTSERSIALDIPPKEHMDPQDNKDPIERTMPAPDVLYYAPITRIDKERREVIGTATAERKDMHRTVIGYEASKDALARWRGNIREMHNPQKAVGKALEVTPDPDNKRIVVRATISKGAEDTWQKVLDGTLTGFSIGGKNGQWTEREIDGEKLPYLERYDAVELSLVDNPSCPGCDIKIVRADGMASEVLAPEDETADIVRVPETEVDRAGAKISADTRSAMHAARDHAMSGAKQIMATCGCDACTDTMNRLAEHDDGDGDMDAPAMRTMIAEVLREVLPDLLRANVAPTLQRVNALLAHDAGRTENPDFTRNFTVITEKHDALAARLDEAYTLIQRIADQPQGGGPVLHGAPLDKRLATQSSPASASDADVMRRAVELGFAPPSDPQQAVKAAAALVRPIPRY